MNASVRIQFAAFLLLSIGAGTATAAASSIKASKKIPVPSAVITSSAPHQNAAGRRYTVYQISVGNLASFPKEFFKTTPPLPPNPCTTNDTLRLLWVVETAKGERQSCGGVAPKNGSNIGAQVRAPEGESPEVRLVLIDRKTEKRYVSKPFTLSATK